MLGYTSYRTNSHERKNLHESTVLAAVLESVFIATAIP
jgi:hypothetical protein